MRILSCLPFRISFDDIILRDYQLSDVEDETNGLYTYDRKICKVTKADFRELGRKLDEAMKAQNK